VDAVFKVYYTDVPQPRGTTPKLAKLVPLQFQTRRQAIDAACRIIKAGHVVWQIEDSAGGTFDRDQVEEACRGTGFYQFNAGPDGSLIIDSPPILKGFPKAASTPTVASTGGMTHKQHRDRAVKLPPTRPKRRTR
jgi:hypothetical protein